VAPAAVEEPRVTILDQISKGGVIAYVILVMSFITLSLIIEHFVSIRAERLCPGALVQEFQDYLNGEQYEEALELCNVENNLLTNVVRAGLSRTDEGFESMKEGMEEAGAEGALLLQQKVSYLNLIGNIAPMVGLLGTVDGMVGAFGTIGRSTVVKASALAGCISEALVCTLLGLAVAIPAMCAYQYFSNRAMRCVLAAGAQATDLMKQFRVASAPRAAARDVSSWSEATARNSRRSAVSPGSRR
jgi:biopolymer transport protein ExbB